MVASGVKYVENRTWGKNSDGRRTKGLDGMIGIHRGGRDGAIIATCKVKMIISPEQALKHFPDQEDHIGGPQCWILTEVRKCQPIPCKGKLGVWECDIDPANIKYID
jgi:hypothetical protein